MSQELFPCPEVGPDESRTPWLVFLLVWGVFFLAEPLDVAFSNNELVQVDAEEEGGNLERAERNIEENLAGSLRRQIGLAGLALLGVWQLRRPGRRLRIRALLGEAILLFLLWCGASIFWSDEPRVTVRKLGVLGCLAVGALGMVRSCSLRQLIRFALFSTGLLMVLGVPCEIVLGNFRPLHPDYRFSGLTWPAFTAWSLSIFVVAALALHSYTSRPRLLDVLALAAFGLCLLTKTRASAGGLVAALLFHAAATWPFRRWATVVLLGGFSASVLGLASEALGGRLGTAVFTLVTLGRSESTADVSGRAGLWNDLAPYLANRPLIGYGYESFWTPARLLAVGQDNWGAPDAHNSYLNLALGAGVVVTGLLVCILLLAFRRAWSGYRTTAKPEYLFLCEMLIILVINSGFVSTILAPAVYSFAGMVVLAYLGFAEESPPPDAAAVPGVVS